MSQCVRAGPGQGCFVRLVANIEVLHFVANTSTVQTDHISSPMSSWSPIMLSRKACTLNPAEECPAPADLRQLGGPGLVPNGQCDSSHEQRAVPDPYLPTPQRGNIAVSVCAVCSIMGNTNGKQATARFAATRISGVQANKDPFAYPSKALGGCCQPASPDLRSRSRPVLSSRRTTVTPHAT